MGVPMDFDDDVERRNTHPLLLPPQEAKRMSTTDGRFWRISGSSSPL